MPAGAGARHRRQAGRRAGRGPCLRHPASRHQAGEHHGQPLRHGGPFRLRAGVDHLGARRPDRFPRGAHPGLLLARDVPRRGTQRPGRRLLARGHPVRPAVRVPAALHGRREGAGLRDDHEAARRAGPGRARHPARADGPAAGGPCRPTRRYGRRARRRCETRWPTRAARLPVAMSGYARPRRRAAGRRRHRHQHQRPDGQAPGRPRATAGQPRRRGTARMAREGPGPGGRRGTPGWPQGSS